MADIKITDLVAYTSPASTDVLPIVDVGADVTKKVSVEDLFAGSDANINGLTAGRGSGGLASNTVLGNGAFASNSSGSSNVAIGLNALRDNQTGINNVAVGRNTALVATDIDNSTIVGYAAGQALTTGRKNIFLGFGAGTQVTTGSNNTIIGDIDGTAALEDTVIIGAGINERLRINSSGDVGIGTTSPGAKLDVDGDALINNLTVGAGGGGLSTNVALGFNALASNTTGANNVAIGHSALDANVSGNNNIAIGRLAGSAATGNSNTMIGYAAGQNVTTGTRNIFLGIGAGTQVTTGSNNTIIGDIDGTAALEDTVIIAAGITERMRIDSSGNASIGTDTAATDAPLTISNSTDTPALFFQRSSTLQDGAILFSGGQFIFKNQANSATVAGLSESMRIDTAGRVGIGISSPDTNSKVDVDGRVQSSQDFVATTRGTNGGVADFILLTSASGGANLGARIRHDGAADVLSIANDPGTSTQHLLIRGNGVMNYALCPTYADDTAAGSGGLVAGDIYKTSTGELRIKL